VIVVSSAVLAPADNEHTAAVVAAILGDKPPLPSSIALDARTSAVVWQGPGVPTRSQLQRWRSPN
jgi:hypothetical protein